MERDFIFEHGGPVRAKYEHSSTKAGYVVTNRVTSIRPEGQRQLSTGPTPDSHA